ncbi:hypothetical protein GGS26DRAFT_136400 [Hypomontagnella submonticulosa]|nr:hypothetical protein GGS26DRAFT_136400 [Hypomontagnella submonticulosa]
MADPSSSLLWTVSVLVTALSLSPLTTYTSAYLAAPHEITAFLDALDCSIQENESYDSDVSKVQRLEDKIRLGRLLREIQKCSDDLREELNRLVVVEGEGTSVLRTGARVLWASHRRTLEERVRRLDMLRMRFLVLYMGIVTNSMGERVKHAERAVPKEAAARHFPHATPPPRAPALPKQLTSNKQTPPLRRLTTPAMGHHEKHQPPHRAGWLGVMEELQRSPMLHKRHASVEASMRSPSISPLGSPLALTPEMDTKRFHETIEILPEHKI